MPYSWKTPDKFSAQPEPLQELHLWPHQSLPPRGYAGFIGVTFAMILLPLFAVLGTVLGTVALWALLPF